MMRQNQSSRRSRGRGGRKPGNNRNQIFDSNGPGARVRGNSAQIYEKYQQLARDASSSGDRVAAENFYQHAEHYYRLMEVAGLTRTLNGPDDMGGRDDPAGRPTEGAGGFDTAEPEVAAAAPERVVAEPAEPVIESAPDANSQPVNGAAPDEGESKPVRRARGRRGNGAANGRGAAEGDADADVGEAEAEAASDDTNPVVA